MALFFLSKAKLEATKRLPSLDLLFDHITLRDGSNPIVNLIFILL